MTRVKWLRTGLGGSWILGAFLTSWMTHQFFALRARSGSFHSICNVHDAFNCDRIFLSESAELFPGVPLSSLGLAWFLFALACFWQGRKEEKAAVSLQIQALMGLVGTLVGCYYVGVMAFQLKTFCLFCLGVDVLNAVSMVLALALLPKKDWFVAPHFSLMARLILNALPSFLVILGAWRYGIGMNPPIPEEQIERYLKQFFAQPRKILTDSHTSAMRLGTPGAVIQIHEFSDFQCPFCKEAAKLFHRMVERFPGKIEVHFHNLPLSSKCNPRVSVDYHTAACQAAKAVICGSWQGQFEAVYTHLFEKQDQLESGNILSLLTSMSLDEKKMSRCLQDSDTAAALARDLTLADQLGINGVTPTFIIEGYPLQGHLPFPVLDALIRKLLNEKMD